MSPREPRGEEYFGKLNAGREPLDELAANHLVLASETRIKAEQRSEGKCIVVGTKGSGKTDLRRMVEHHATGWVFTADADRPVLVLDEPDVSLSPLRLQHALAFSLIEAMLRTLAQEQPSLKDRFDELRHRALDLLQSTVQKIEYASPVGLFRFSDLTRTTVNEAVHRAWRNSVDEIVKRRKNRAAVLLLDDVDTVIPGTADQPNLLEGVFHAVQAINDYAGSALHVLVFVKHGPWRNVFENQVEYDKVKSRVEFLQWTPDHLEDLIAMRIASIHGLDHDVGSVDSRRKLWAKEFDITSKAAYRRIAGELTRHCVNGPRDMIDLCNLVGHYSGRRKATPEALEEILPTYSEEKLFSISADFGSSFPDLQHFILQVLRDAPVEAGGDQYVDLVDQNAYQNDQVDDVYRKHRWYNLNAPAGIVRLLYEVGFFGLVVEGDVSYVMERPRIRQDQLLSNPLRIHPAFLPYLGSA